MFTRFPYFIMHQLESLSRERCDDLQSTAVMPNSLTRIDMWNYTWGVLSTLALLGLLTYFIVKVRLWYTGDEEDSCDWQTTLTEFRQLEEKGLITREEFQRIKNQVISSNPSLIPAQKDVKIASDDSVSSVEESLEEKREKSKDEN